jgi:hypothetical protein
MKRSSADSPIAGSRARWILPLEKRGLLWFLLFLLLTLSLVAAYRLREGRRAGISADGALALTDPELDLLSRLLQQANSSSFRGASPIYKGVYLTSWTAGTARREDLIRLVERTELNALVLDIKDYSGRVGYLSRVSLAQEIGSSQDRIKDIEAFLLRCHRSGIYVIGRIVVFQDPWLAKCRPEWAIKDRDGEIWRDRKGLSWLDPACQQVWEYNLDLAKEAVGKGFDEIQFDYVRFPSDGRISSCRYPFWDQTTPKHQIIRQFFAYASQELAPFRVPISVDLFGLTLWRDDDLNIGQRIIDAMDYVDYICPMVYPSHYPPHFLGFENPALHPYEIVYQSLIRGQSILSRANARARLRPWLQDFDLGARYDAEQIRWQKKATYEAQACGWFLWNPQNRYTESGLEPDWVGRLVALRGAEELEGIRLFSAVTERGWGVSPREGGTGAWR